MAITSFYQRDFPTLVLDEKYILREQSLEDTEAFFKYYADPEVCRYILAMIPTNLSEAETEIQYCQNLFKSRQGIFWTIARRDTNQMIGAVGMYMNNFHHRAEISYDMDKQYWGRGIMGRAIRMVCRYAFEQMEVTRIEAVTLKENTQSIRLLKKNGFHYEGMMRNYKYFKGRAFDIEMFSAVPKTKS